MYLSTQIGLWLEENKSWAVNQNTLSQIKRGTKRIEDIEGENNDAELALLNVMDKWIQDQGW